MDRRRRLAFASLDDVMPEVERLLAGHVTVGNWSLGQICNHLATAFHLVVDVAPRDVAPGRREVLVAWLARRWFFAVDRFPTGVKVPSPRLIPRPGADARREAEALREAIARFVSAPGPFPTHPILGPLTRAQWVELHRRHCAHHLGFALPRSIGGRETREFPGRRASDQVT
ncbi:MAG TPA: DUF1569 domain-containing protein [Isosphaeraceae bacterium]|jgi:hypothetical protein|nr:DUF1569 domain-containing protein [Isosphaeraceae bacterium]